ncbi:MAG TPA: helix-turn-helix domain-containing protein [Geminicoccus sp.]|uniref:helix-turn-helix domain-containing protein n=1 Tax=Geminicoccus sp. TaxID=2024832 RepID=UPI002BF5C762|nr:helix-turn-helix domain-containing protein [Geminicoccus sp.]HWL69792.1 helix-turn-helix domain-containing protein [Geminicoccus sp.]
MAPGSTSAHLRSGPPGEAAALSIGRELRAVREQRGEDLYDVADLLRIKPAYLLALEQGDHARLPGIPYAHGFLRSYAEHLGLDGQKFVRRLKAAGAVPAAPTASAAPAFRVPPAEERRPTMVVALALLVLAGAGYGGWSYLGLGGEAPPEAVAEAPYLPPPDLPLAVRQPPPAPLRPDPIGPAVPERALAAAPTPAVQDLPSVAEVLAVAATAPVPAHAAPAPDGSAAADAPQPAAALAVAAAPAGAGEAAAAAEAVAADEGRPSPGVGAAVAGEARVVLVATEPAWIQVRSADRSFSRSRLMEAGERFLLPERADLALWTGNAGGLQVVVDGAELAPLGARGAVLRDVPLDPAALKARLTPAH